MSAALQNLFGPNTTARLEALRRRWAVPGLSVTIVKVPPATKAFESYYQGFGTINPKGDHLTDQSIINIASNSKLVTAYALALLISQGFTLPNGEKLGWKSKIKDILPNWRLKDPVASELTDLSDLLCMRTGLPAHDRIQSHQGIADTLSTLRYFDQSSEFRQTRQYSNINYTIIAHIVSTLSKLPFTQFVEEKIFLPLKMTSTTYRNIASERHAVHRYQQRGWDASSAVKAWKSAEHNVTLTSETASLLPSGHGTEFSDNELTGVPVSFGPCTYLDYEYMAGPAGVNSTAHDLALWLKELLNPTLIPQSLFDEITTPHILAAKRILSPEDGIKTYGYGVYILNYRGHKVCLHGGGVPGQYSFILFLPEDGLGFAAYSNDDVHGYEVCTIAVYTLLDQLLGIENDQVDWEKRIMDQRLEKKDNPLPQERVPRDIAGKYTHVGYPSLNVEPLESSHPLYALLPSIQNDIQRKLNMTEMHITEYEVEHHSHILFMPDGAKHIWIGLKLHTIHDEIGPTDERCAVLDGHGECVFTDDGLGMFGNFWVQGDEAEKREVVTGHNVRYAAEVYFEKMID